VPSQSRFSSTNGAKVSYRNPALVLHMHMCKSTSTAVLVLGLTVNCTATKKCEMYMNPQGPSKLLLDGTHLAKGGNHLEYSNRTITDKQTKPHVWRGLPCTCRVYSPRSRPLLRSPSWTIGLPCTHVEAGYPCHGFQGRTLDRGIFACHTTNVYGIPSGSLPSL